MQKKDLGGWRQLLSWNSLCKSLHNGYCGDILYTLLDIVLPQYIVWVIWQYHYVSFQAVVCTYVGWSLIRSSSLVTGPPDWSGQHDLHIPRYPTDLKHPWTLTDSFLEISRQRSMISLNASRNLPEWPRCLLLVEEPSNPETRSFARSISFDLASLNILNHCFSGFFFFFFRKRP